MDPITTLKRTSATIISTSVNPAWSCLRSMLTMPPRLEGGSLPGLPRYVTGQLRRLGPVGIVPSGRDVDFLASSHRNRIRDRPRAGEHRSRVGEGPRREEREALALQLLQLDLGRHEAR